MIARVWQGIVPVEKAEAYARYLAESNLGIRGYRAIRGNRGVSLLRRVEGGRIRFLLISLWDSEEAIREYAGADIERARYFDFDRECLLDPDPNVVHYEILAGTGVPELAEPGTLTPPRESR
jgi:heme-degrading monooxygenase HmoA